MCIEKGQNCKSCASFLDRSTVALEAFDVFFVLTCVCVQLKAADEVGWNASFLRSDTVVSALADKLQVDKGDIMDHNESGMAVRLALGETKLIEENKAYFKEHGINVDLESLKSITSASGGKRSSTTILVKNLPYETTEEDLTKTFANYGIIAKLLLPPSLNVFKWLL